MAEREEKGDDRRRHRATNAVRRDGDGDPVSGTRRQIDGVIPDAVSRRDGEAVVAFKRRFSDAGRKDPKCVEASDMIRLQLVRRLSEELMMNSRLAFEEAKPDIADANAPVRREEVLLNPMRNSSAITTSTSRRGCSPRRLLTEGRQPHFARAFRLIPRWCPR